MKSDVSDIFHKDMKEDHTQVAMVMASCQSASRLEVDVLQSTCNGNLLINFQKLLIRNEAEQSNSFGRFG